MPLENTQTSESDLIDAMWEVMRGDSNFLPMIRAWDSLLDGLEGDASDIHKTMLSRIATDFERLDTGLELQLAQTSKQLSDSTLVLSPAKKVVQAPTSSSFSGIDFDHLVEAVDLEDGDPQLLWSKRDSPLLVVLFPAPLGNTELQQKSYRVEVSEHVWQDQYAESLKQAFNLTKSELDILKLIFEGDTSEAIAERRSRSVNTVRAQIKSVLSKMEVSSQRRLVHMVANTFLMLDRLKEQTITVQASVQKVCNQPEVMTYGDKSAEPLLLLSPIVHPSFYAQCEALLQKRKRCLIVPFNYSAKPSGLAEHKERIAEMCDAIYKEHRPTQIAGIAAGGLWALDMAITNQWDVSRVVQIDTGYPRKSLADFRHLPRDAKRSFLIARYTPRILLAGHKVVANDFFTSADGMERVLSFFYRGQEFDHDQLLGDPSFRAFTERLIQYSFEQIEQLVYNVVYWNMDWSNLMSRPRSFEIKSVLGKHSALFDLERYKAWAENQGVDHYLEPQSGQQSVFNIGKILSRVL